MASANSTSLSLYLRSRPQSSVYLKADPSHAPPVGGAAASLSGAPTERAPTHKAWCDVRGGAP
eukprot:6200532-Pleurochrysis_carterae.AAC.1